MPGRARAVAAAVFAAWGTLAPAAAQTPALPDPRPELTTLLGRPVFARPDDSGAIAKADADLAAAPGDIDRLLAAARARDAALQFHSAIELYTRGLALAPADVRLLRFRGHRYISIRKFDLAANDLEKALALAPTSFDVAYHLGLAHYLRGDFAAAARAYRSCLDATAPGPLPPEWRSCTATRRTDNDLVAMSDWLYRALRRAGQAADAQALLASIAAGLKVGENEAYYAALRFYKGELDEVQALTGTGPSDNRLVTVGYGIAVHYLANGDGERGCLLLDRIAAEPNWNAFGVIAAEADLARTGGACR
jgi:tetratricopeptide (TPR) repeat protein